MGVLTFTPQPSQQSVLTFNPTPEGEPVGVAEDMLRSGAAGLRRGVEAIPGMGGDVPALGRAGIAKVAQWLGASPETQKNITDYDIPYAPNLPTTEDIHEFTTPTLGKSYEPQTTAGKYARTGMEFLPAFASNPLKGGLQFAGRLALGGATGLLSEGAGQATEGTALEPWARAGAGLAGGAAALGGPAAVKAIRQAPERAAEIAAEDAARVHGVELTKGQRSGNVTQQRAEQEMLRGARGDRAQRLMQQRSDQNLSALDQSMESLSNRVAPTRGSDPVQAGDILNQTLRERVARLKAQGGQQIESALNSGVMMDADRLRGLPAQIRQNLAGPTPYVPDVVLGPNTPAANAAMERLSTFASQASDPAVREFSLAGGEQLRKNIGKLAAEPGTDDARALAAIQRHFDDWLEGSVQGGTSPDPAGPAAALAELQQGRATYGSGARIDRPRSNERQIPGATAVSKVARDNHPEDTARLFTPTQRGTITPTGTDAVTRLADTGATSSELDQVRGMILDNLTGSGGPQRRSSRFRTFLEENPTAVERLFSPQDTGDFQGWIRTNEALVPDPLAMNPSGTSYGVIKEMGKLGQKAAANSGALIGGSLGGWPGAILGYGISKGTDLLQELGNRSAVSEALSPADRRRLASIIAAEAAKGSRRAIPGTLAGQER